MVATHVPGAARSRVSPVTRSRISPDSETLAALIWVPPRSIPIA
jgi:hypothetical protein